MALSLTCACGAKLEVDEAFRGKIITCPDCQKPLPTVQPPRPPLKTSGFALGSILFALIGAFTFVGPVVAVVLGVLGLRSIRRAPDRLGGRRLALAGIFLGVGFGLLSVAAFMWADRIGLDRLARSLVWADQLDYSGDLEFTLEQVQGPGFFLKKPDRQWGRFTSPPSTAGQKGDSLVLVNVAEDAYILVLDGVADLQDDAKESRFKALDSLQASPFLRRLGRLGVNDKFPDLKAIKEIPDSDGAEFQLEVKLAGIPRTLFLRVERQGGQLYVVVCMTRKHRFQKLEETFDQVLKSFKIVQ